MTNDLQARVAELEAAVRKAWRELHDGKHARYPDAIKAASDILDAALTAATLRAEKAENELRRVDELLARRAALDDLDHRVAKIGKAMGYAARTDAAERKVETIRAETVAEYIAERIRALYAHRTEGGVR